MKISLNVIVKDEEKTIGRCLQSLAKLVDEIVVVDTGSTDNTKKIAATFGAKIYDFKWIDDFSAARNAAIEHSTGDWIFAIDADEYLPPESQQKFMELRPRLNTLDKTYYFIRVLKKNGVETLYQPKLFLFPNLPEIRWKYSIHEQIVEGLYEHKIAIEKYHLEIINETTETKAENKEKQLKYYTRLKEELEKYPNEFSILYHLGKHAFEFEKYYECAVYLTQALENSPKDTVLLEDMMFYLVASLYFCGRMSDSLNLLAHARSIFPYNVYLINFEAAKHRAYGRLKEAEQLYLGLIEFSKTGNVNLIQQSPKMVRLAASISLEEMYKEQGRTKEAEKIRRDIQKEFGDFRKSD